jgi:single-strand DNA-binding protein
MFMYFNEAFIVGNLARDPEPFKLPSGDTKCTLTVATNHIYNDSDGERQESTEFHTVIVFGKRADTVTQFLKKGSLIGVRGHLKTRSWPDANHPDIKHYRTEIIADHVELGPKPA